jgi:outer membrane protein TolC
MKKLFPMNKSISLKTRFILLFIFFLLPATFAGNEPDSLRLSEAIQKVIEQHPTVQLSLEALKAADTRISLARTGYLPDVDVSASYSHVGPVPSFDIPNIGHIQFIPADNYSASLNAQQNIYDFGRTSKRIAAEMEGKQLGEEQVEVVRQNLTKRVISLYYTLAYTQEALKIKEQQIDNLKLHLERVVKKQETGSATDYEVLSTQVKLTAAETQRTELNSMLSIQLAILNTLLGVPSETPWMLSSSTSVPMVDATQDSVVAGALRERAEVKVAAAREELMKIRIDLARTENKPALRAFASAGWKDGYIPEINKLRGNYAAGLSLKIPLFDANRTKYNVMLAQSSLTNSVFEKDLAARDITNEVVEYYQKKIAAIHKVEQGEAQVRQAARAHELANTSFNAGAITNLDLLDATTVLSESRLMLLKARIDLLMNYYGLELAAGKKLF